MHRIATTIAALLLSLGIIAGAQAQNTVVTPKDAYAEIDTRRDFEIVNLLIKGSPEQQQQAIATITANPGNYAPPVYYVLGNVLLRLGKGDEGAFWFYFGQLRARFDANRCADVSARSAVGALNQEYGPPVNKYALQDIPKLEALIPKVVEFDRNTPHNYDRRWINLHGMAAMQSAMGKGNPDAPPPVMSLPTDQWPAIAEKTRADYLEGFKEALASIKAKP